MKLCKTCKYHKEITLSTDSNSLDQLKAIYGWTDYTDVCSYENEVDLVSGVKLYRRCGFARSAEGHCGKIGRHHEEA